MPRKKSPYVRPPMSKKDRAYIYKFTDGTCYYCGKGLPNPNDWSWEPMWVDHMEPISKGGDAYAYSNQVPSCPDCNRRKRDRTPEDFKKYLMEVVYWKLDEALELLHLQKQYGAPEAELKVVEDKIKEAQQETFPVEWEMAEYLFPGEALVKEFFRKRAERLNKVAPKPEPEKTSE